MKRIICDTMIWYELSKGRLKLPNKDEYSLVCTYLTLTELAFTPNNFNKLEEVQIAIKQILEAKPQFVLLFPFDYARVIIDDTYKPKFQIENDLVFGFLRILLNYPNTGLEDNDFKEQLSNICLKRKSNSFDWADFLNNLHSPLKEIRGILKKYQNEEADHSFFQNLFIHEINICSEVEYPIEMVDWSEFEFYGRMFNRYKRNLLLTGMKADKNDQADLENMIYVQPNDLYWTLEKRWLTIAKESKLENYLYKQ